MFKRIASVVILLLLVVALWEGLRHSGLLDGSLLPSTSQIGSALRALLKTGRFWEDFGATLARSMSGLGIAIAIGVPLGLLIGSFRWLSIAGVPLVDFFRSIPVTTLYPVFVLCLGIGNISKVAMIFLGCVLVIILNSAAGFEQRSRIRHHVSRLYGLSSIQILARVSFFEALPSILTGLRVAVGLALIVCTLTEMFMGAATGMGQSLMEAYSVYNLPKMFGYIIVLGTTGYLLNTLLALAEARTNLWRAR